MKQLVRNLSLSDEELVAALTEELKVTPRRPDGFGVTAIEFAAKNHMADKTARKLLDSLVAEGKLKKTVMRHRWGVGAVYHRKP